MTDKQKSIVMIATTKGDTDVVQKAVVMKEKECDEYLQRIWDSFSKKQKELANRDNPSGWAIITIMSDEECDQRIKMKEKNKSFAMDLSLNP